MERSQILIRRSRGALAAAAIVAMALAAMMQAPPAFAATAPIAVTRAAC